MSSSLKNLLILLSVLIFAFAGYYIFVQKGDTALSLEGNDYVDDQMRKDTQLFIERSAVLSRVKIDTTVFEDQNFSSYKDFSRDIVEQQVRNSNPFTDASRSFGAGNF